MYAPDGNFQPLGRLGTLPEGRPPTGRAVEGRGPEVLPMSQGQAH